MSPAVAAAAAAVTRKVTVLGLQLVLLSGAGQRAQFEVEDAICILHNALASDRQRLGPEGLQVTTLDLTLAAARLTAYSAGKTAAKSCLSKAAVWRAGTVVRLDPECTAVSASRHFGIHHVLCSTCVHDVHDVPVPSHYSIYTFCPWNPTGVPRRH